jgi:hypothetical protein
VAILLRGESKKENHVLLKEMMEMVWTVMGMGGWMGG